MVTMATLVWQIELQGLCIVKNITLHVSIEVLFLMTYCTYCILQTFLSKATFKFSFQYLCSRIERMIFELLGQFSVYYAVIY